MFFKISLLSKSSQCQLNVVRRQSRRYISECGRTQPIPQDPSCTPYNPLEEKMNELFEKLYEAAKRTHSEYEEFPRVVAKQRKVRDEDMTLKLDRVESVTAKNQYDIITTQLEPRLKDLQGKILKSNKQYHVGGALELGSKRWGTKYDLKDEIFSPLDSIVKRERNEDRGLDNALKYIPKTPKFLICLEEVWFMVTGVSGCRDFHITREEYNHVLYRKYDSNEDHITLKLSSEEFSIDMACFAYLKFYWDRGILHVPFQVIDTRGGVEKIIFQSDASDSDDRYSLF